ncbi:MAG: thiamine pyrophosphate-binding protein [Acidobacteriota bacterium]
MKRKVADLLLTYLAEEGVEHMFGVPGLPLMPLFEACKRDARIKLIISKHEEGAAFMADGYARIKGCPGVCFSTSGPGATNLVTGVASAHCNNTPLLVLTGQVHTATYGKGTFQDSTKKGIDSVAMFDAMTRQSSMVISRYRAEEEIREALRVALSGKQGPVHLSIPRDILASEVEEEFRTHGTYRPPMRFFDRELVIQAAERLMEAANPVILIGSGAVRSGACEDVRALAEMLHIPVASTPKAKGAFPEDHPLALGVLGLNGSPLANHYVRSGTIDVLLAVGASLNQITTSSWDPRIAPTKALIQNDIDPAEVGKNYKVDIPLVGDACTVINELSFRVLRYLGEAADRIRTREDEVARLRQEIGMFVDPEKMRSESSPVKPQRLMSDLQEAMPEDALLFVDTGNCLLWAGHYLTIRRPNSFVAEYGLLSMGYGMAAPIGGKLAAPDRPVISVAGDGAFLMNGTEVATAVNYDIPVVWIIQNNARLALIHVLQKAVLGADEKITPFKRIDCARVAEGLGAVGYRIEKPGELVKVLPEALATRRPAVIDCIIDDTEVPPLGAFIEGLQQFAHRLEMM